MIPIKEEKTKKFCCVCGGLLTRNRYITGLLEGFYDFKIRKTCGNKCRFLLRRGAILKPDSVVFSTTRSRAQRLKATGGCEMCGAKDAKIVHHKDENPTNNTAENLARVCCKCHINLHKPWKNKVKKYKEIGCKRCGNKFVPKRDVNVFCSKSCAGKTNLNFKS